MTLRKFVLSLALAMGFINLSPAYADPDPKQATDMVANLAQQAVVVMTGKDISEKDRIAKFRTLFISSVDIPSVSRFVLARHWKVATPDQQKEFMGLFEDMLVYTWASRFKDASDKISVKVVGTKPDGDDGIIVESHILREGQDPIPVFWRLRQVDNSLRIIDLLIEGTSMIVTYREEYASVVNQNGGSVAGLLELLHKKVDTMAAQQNTTKTN